MSFSGLDIAYRTHLGSFSVLRRSLISNLQTSQILSVTMRGGAWVGYIRNKLILRAIYFGAMIGANYGEPFFSRGPLAIGNFSGLEKDKSLNVAFSPYLT